MTEGTTVVEKAAAARRGLWRRREALVLQGAFVLWILWSVGVGLWQANSARTLSAPHALGGLAMEGKAVQGQEAVAQMTRLHGKDVDLSDGYVAHYRSAGGEAVLYVGQTQSATVADTLTERMRARIVQGGSPFNDLSTLPIDGRVVYRVVGLGAEHFFFSIGDKAVWLTLAGEDADAALRATFDGVR